MIIEHPRRSNWKLVEPEKPLETTDARGSLSAALVAALRTATALRDSTDSVQVVVVSPLAAESFDAATAAVRALWPAAIEVVRLAAAADDAAPAAVQVRAVPDDALTVAAALLGPRPAGQPARLLREAPTAADSAWARDSAGLLVVWPDSGAPAGWADAPRDTVGAVTAGGGALVAPFVRTARAPEGGVARAWWVDGLPAAVETVLGAGCVRAVAVPVAGAGDLPLRAAFHDFLHALLAPCGGARDLAARPDGAVAWLAGGGAAALAVRHDPAQQAPLVPWLLGAALVLLLVELLVRRSGGER